MPPSPNTIRPATEADVPEILAMIQELALYEKAPDSVQATVQTLSETLIFPSNPNKGYAKTLLIFPAAASTPAKRGMPLAPPPPSAAAAPAQKPAGMALFFYNYSTWRAAPGIYLEDLFVRPEHRGKGYGRALLAALAKETLDVNGGRLDWSVLKWNEPSIGFYQSEAVGAERMEEWVGMRVEGKEKLEKLARSLES